MHRTTILDFSPERSFSMSVRIMSHILRGRSIDIHDADDLASVVAFRFEVARGKGRIKGNPLAFLRGIARNVYRETLRAKNRQIRTIFGAEIPEMSHEDDEEIHPVKAEFISRLQESLSPNERSIMPDFVWPGDRLWKEIAEQHGKSESAFSEAVRRLCTKAELLHRTMATETLGGILGVPTADAQDRLIGLARTPRERSDFRLRLVEVCQSLAITRFKDRSCERAELLRDAETQLGIVSTGFAARSCDPGLQGALYTFRAAQLQLTSLSLCEDCRFELDIDAAYFAIVTDALSAYRSYGDEAGEVGIWQVFADYPHFTELSFDSEHLADPHTVRIQHQTPREWFQEFVTHVKGRPEISLHRAFMDACIRRIDAGIDESHFPPRCDTSWADEPCRRCGLHDNTLRL